jgi:hypothetical protein
VNTGLISSRNEQRAAGHTFKSKREHERESVFLPSSPAHILQNMQRQGLPTDLQIWSAFRFA